MLARNAAAAALAAALILIPARSSAVTDAAAPPRTETATLAGGCFWCLEAVFQELAGVTRVVSGYAGGGPGPVTYKEVCTGTTGHAEAVQVTFDPAVISYAELLAAFFTIHDPTTLDRQGADVGPQYRSAIFAHQSRRVCFIGHSHQPGGWRDSGSSVKKGQGESFTIADDDRWLVNVGSVGQPRDHDPRASYALYDIEAGIVRLRRVTYDVGAAQAKILAAGLPESLAKRLD